MRRLVILRSRRYLCGLLAPIASADPARGAVFSGAGVWIDIWDALEKTPDKVVATAVHRGWPACDPVVPVELQKRQS